MEYRVRTEEDIRRTFKSNLKLDIGTALVLPFVWVEIILILLKAGKKIDIATKILFYILSVVIPIVFIWAIGVLLYLYFHPPPRCTHVDIKDNKIILTMDNKEQKVYPFNDFANNVVIEIGFTTLLSVFRYSTMLGFFNEGIPEILEVLKKKPYTYKTENILSIAIYKLKGKRIWPRNIPWLSFNVQPSTIGGIDNIEKMLLEWKEKYENYLKRTGRYEEAMRKEEEEKVITPEKRKKAFRHFMIYTLILIFSIVSFVFLSLRPYLNTPKSSPRYDTVVTVLTLDATLTFMLIIFGIILLPVLWKKAKGKASDDDK